MAVDLTVTRFPNGVTNNLDTSPFASLKIPDITGYHWFFEDFDQFTAAQWTTGGVGTPVAPLLVSGDGGKVSLTTSNVSADNNWLQQLVPAWTITAGKRLFFSARSQLDATTFGAVGVGLQVAVAANNFLTPADGVFFRKSSATADVVLVSRVGGVETVSAVAATLSGSNTGVAYSFAYDGQGTITAGINGTVVASITPASITAVALGIVAGVQATSAATRTFLWDQIFCAKER